MHACVHSCMLVDYMRRWRTYELWRACHFIHHLCVQIKRSMPKLGVRQLSERSSIERRRQEIMFAKRRCVTKVRLVRKASVACIFGIGLDARKTTRRLQSVCMVCNCSGGGTVLTCHLSVLAHLIWVYLPWRQHTPFILR